MISDIRKYREKYKNSDLKRLVVTSDGSFFMPSEEIFNDKDESLELIHRLRHSVHKYQNRRRHNTNLIKKRFYIPEENKWITIRVSKSALRQINKKGISAVIKEAREKGYMK